MSVGTADAYIVLEHEQIRGLAPDHATLRTADELALSDRWGSHGWSVVELPAGGRLLWAEFPESRRAPTHTVISWPDLRAACSCAATRFPCRHIIALLLRDANDDLPHERQPEWACPALPTDDDDRPADDPAAEARRRAALVAGMADLQRWLGDLAHRGLADLPRRGRAPWLAAANRLDDTYAVEAARELRALATIPGSSAGWPERILPRLGRLALLCAAFGRLDALPPGERGDALAAAGWSPWPADDHVRDRWLVTGRRLDTENRQVRSRTWLYGTGSGRWASLSETHAAGRLAGYCLPVGATFSCELVFYPSARPLMAGLVEPPHLCAPLDSVDIAASTIDGGIAAYAAALAANPWLRAYPFALREVFIEPPGPNSPDRWQIRDRGGRLLPLPQSFAHGWRLLSLAADRPLTLFGEWDGAVFTPLSVDDGGWRAMAGWRGLA